MPEAAEQPRLLVVTGLSGSGKSVALHALEDLGFYCVDNLPAGMLQAFSGQLRDHPERFRRTAVGIDARAGREELAGLPERMDALPGQPGLIFLTAEDPVLIRRFSETRRRHPLADERSLEQAIAAEREWMAPLRERADRVIDTSETNIHQLRRRIWEVAGTEAGEGIRSLVLESFAFKHGVPRDVDLVFDARCLPNPHWQPELRAATGLELAVREFLDSDARVARFADDVQGFIERWLPGWSEDKRSHLTVGIGCTGGRHRSVYLVETLSQRLRDAGLNVVTHHRELSP